MAGALAVKGLRELNQTFKQAPKETRAALRREYRHVAEPVRASAEQRASTEIRNIGEPWSQMRVGITQKLVYVAPKKRGVKTLGGGGLRRPNLAPLLATRALEPALEANRHRIELEFGQMLDRLTDDWNHDG